MTSYAKTPNIAVVAKPAGTTIGRRQLANGGPIVSGGTIFVTKTDFGHLKKMFAALPAVARAIKQTEADGQEDDQP